MAVAAPAAAAVSPPSFLLAGPRPNPTHGQLRLAGLRTPSLSPAPAAFFPNSSLKIPSLARTASPIRSRRHSAPPAALPRVSCFLSSLKSPLLSSFQSPLLSGTPPTADPSTARTVAAAIWAFVHEKLVPLLSRTPTAEELSRLASFSLAAAQHVLGLGPSGSAVDFRTPLLALAAAASKWVGLYSEILMVVCLLSWFPNMPWNRQPLSAMRDLTDPYMRLFRGIVPPVFGTMDVSSLIGFALLGVVRSMLNVGGGDGGGMWAD